MEQGRQTIEVELDGEGALERTALRLVEVSLSGLRPSPPPWRRLAPLAEGLVLGQLLRDPAWAPGTVAPEA